MKVLFLGDSNASLIDFIWLSGDEVVAKSDRMTMDFLEENDFDFLVSHGYRHIIKKEVIDRFPNKIINLHISFLPYNRGSDPNFWSFIDHTPKGVTIHLIGEGVDTGAILVQKEVFFSGNETLKTSYDILQNEIQTLFRENWTKIKNGDIAPQKQIGPGTFHRMKDKECMLHLLDEGYETPVSKFILMGSDIATA